MSKVEDLFPELKGTAVETEVKKSLVHDDIPDALVLCLLRVQCRCGEVHEVPNPKLLLRYGRNRLSVKNWMAWFNSLPKEVIVRIEHSIACKVCFGHSGWIFTDFKTEQGEIGEQE